MTRAFCHFFRYINGLQSLKLRSVSFPLFFYFLNLFFQVEGVYLQVICEVIEKASQDARDR